jgi:hypothetical protein
MSRKLFATAAAIAVVALAVGGGTFASASSSDHQSRTLTFIEKSTNTFVDLGPTGAGLGDELVFNGRLWNTAQTRQVGSTHGYCVVVDLQRGLVHCVGSATLRGGSLQLSGTIGQTATFTVAITGGTGAYQGVGGRLVVHNLNQQGTLSRDVFNIVVS